jgi:hypothetical protein
VVLRIYLAWLVLSSVTAWKGIDMNVIKVKVQFTLEQATKAQRGSRGIAVLFL